MTDDEGPRRQQQHHFLIVVHGIQSHINPVRALAHRLTLLGVDTTDGSTRVVRATLCLPEAAHRRMFPASSTSDKEEVTDDGVVSYVRYSDGLDDKNGFLPGNDADRARSRRAGFEGLSAVVAGLASRGKPPVTCVVCTMVVPAALDVASALGVPLAAYWIQPAHVLAAYYHYFHGYGDLVASQAAADDPARSEVSLPGLSRPLRIRDFPSFLVDTTGYDDMARTINADIRELFEYMLRRRRRGRPRPNNNKFLVNTFEELEPAVLGEMRRHLDVVAVGPMVITAGSSSSSSSSTEEEARGRLLHLFKHDDVDRKRYMDWLNTQPEKSVVYASFGSLSQHNGRQMDEVLRGLRRCGRPYLLVVRKDDNEVDDEDDRMISSQSQGMMVMEWCNQPEVLSHKAVGCFVTHCGWNSTLEAIASGVPIVCVPNIFDQPTIAYLVEEEWRIGAKTERNDEGIVTGTELARCVELAMGEEGAKASAVRETTQTLKRIAREVAGAGGCAERNLLDFVNAIY